MYAVINAGGFQQKVAVGEILKVPRLADAVGGEVEFSVLLHVDGTEVSVGAPHLEGASVKAEVLSHGRSDKVVVIKKKRRKGYRRQLGHRQPFSEIVVTEISAGGKSHKADEIRLVRSRARTAALARMAAGAAANSSEGPEAPSPIPADGQTAGAPPADAPGGIKKGGRKPQDATGGATPKEV